MMAAAAAALIAAAGGWYLASPWWTLWRMREAVRSGDVERLAAYVDLEAIRGQAARDSKASWGSILRTVRADTPARRRLVELARHRLADPGHLVDFRPWLAAIPIRFAGLGGGSGDAGYRPYVVHRGLDNFELRQEGASLDNGPLLTFRRHGLGWKLAGVRWGQQ
jgi:hypothetical protein